MAGGKVPCPCGSAAPKRVCGTFLGKCKTRLEMAGLCAIRNLKGISSNFFKKKKKFLGVDERMNKFASWICFVDQL